MLARPVLVGMATAAALGLAALDVDATVLCVSQDPTDGSFRGQLQGREACQGDELEIGEIIDLNSGRVELFGHEAQLPRGSFDPDWQQATSEGEQSP